MTILDKIRGIATEANDYYKETEDMIFIRDKNGNLTLLEGDNNDSSTERQ